MISRLVFRLRYGQYLRSAHGVKQFAEMCIGQLVRKVTKKSAFYREMNENLMVEKANLRMRTEELYEQPLMQAGRYFSVRRRLLANGFIITAAVAASIFLIYLSISSYVSTQTAATGFLTWAVAALLAVVLAGGGLIVAERLIETLIPRRDDASRQEQAGLPTLLLWGFLLVGIELTLFGVVEVWADRLALTQESDVLYYGFVALTMLLPIVAGAVRWDAMGHIEAYKTTRAHRDIESRIAQVDSILRQNEEYESNFYKMKSISYWDLLNEFKAVKDMYNERHGMVENLGSHFSQSYDTFQREAYKRYETDIRDLKSTSMRKLKDAGQKGGERKGFKISRLSATPAETFDKNGDRPPAEASDDQSHVKDSELYLSPKPIR